LLMYTAETIIISPSKSMSTPAIPPVDCKIIIIVKRLALTSATIRLFLGWLGINLVHISIKWTAQNAIKNNKTTGITNHPTLTVAGLVKKRKRTRAITHKIKTFKYAFRKSCFMIMLFNHTLTIYWLVNFVFKK
jgi:hypothetical protein